MQIIESVEGMKAFSRRIRGAGKTLGLVPTMGALHEGHLSLLRRAKSQCDSTAVSIFVNPTQFGPGEDFDRYPRNQQKDIDLLRPFNVDAVFTPEAAELYPSGFSVFADPGPMGAVFEGASRPGHFRGVATVVLKLFNIVAPDAAYFGQKDFQQTVVIRRLVADLNLSVRIVICPIMRDPDGMAISSRNAYLSAEEKKSARALSRCLDRAKDLVWNGETSAARVLDAMLQVLAADPCVQLDYAALVEPSSLDPVERIETGCVVLLAARVGSTRLIDNAVLGLRGATGEQLLEAAHGGQRRSGGSLRAPGLQTETLRLQIENCRDCAAITSITLPPREFLVKYLRSDYPDLGGVDILVIGRDSSWNTQNYLYRNPQSKDRFISALLELVGAKSIAEFKKRCVLTDALRCHALVAPVPERALANCARHLREEFKLFPSVRTIVLLGEDAYLQFYRFVLGRELRDVPPWGLLLSDRGWAVEEMSLTAFEGRTLRVISCYHPTAGYRNSPSIAHLLAEAGS